MTNKQVLSLGLLVCVAVGFLAFHLLGEFDAGMTTRKVAVWLQEAGPWAPFLFIGLMAIAVVISPIPSLPLDLAAGAAFGPYLGTSYAVLGAELGAILSFLVSRALGRELLAKFLRMDIVFCEKCSDRHMMIVLILARLLPIFSFDVISYGAGLTNVSLKTFAFATFVGMIPPTFALTSLGNSFTASHITVVVGGLAMVVFFFTIPKLVLRYPHTRWAQWLLAISPTDISPTDTSSVTTQSEHPGEQCSGCGAPLSDNTSR